MKRMIVLAPVTVLLVLVALVLPGPRSSQAQNRATKQWWNSSQTQEVLGLTDDQAERVGELQEAHRERISAIRRMETRSIRELIGVLDDSSTSPGLLEEKRAQLEETWTARLEATMDHWVSLRRVLTTEQWQELPNVAPQVFRMGTMSLRVRSMARVPATDN
jgi:Spy/CpxP family protein refolding chaperone